MSALIGRICYGKSEGLRKKFPWRSIQVSALIGRICYGKSEGLRKKLQDFNKKTRFVPRHIHSAAIHFTTFPAVFVFSRLLRFRYFFLPIFSQELLPEDTWRPFHTWLSRAFFNYATKCDCFIAHPQRVET